MKKIFFGWWIVAAAAAGLAFSPGPVAFYSFGVFMQQLMDEFGWATADVAFAITILTTAIILTTPLIGFAVDRIGPKRVRQFSMLAFAGDLSSVAWVQSLTQFYIAYAVIGIGGAGANSMAYMKLMSAWFDRRRGLVIGIASAGMGVGFAIIPLLTETAIAHAGYRGAYVVLACAILLICVPLVAVIVRDSPEKMGLSPDGEVAAQSRQPADSGNTPKGFTLQQAARMRQFWILILIFFPVGGVTYALAVHLVSIVSEIATRDTAIQAATCPRHLDDGRAPDLRDIVRPVLCADRHLRNLAFSRPSAAPCSQAGQVGLVGESGCGKSTLGRLVLGYEQGEIRIFSASIF